MQFFEWISHMFAKGGAWVLEQGANGVVYIVGESCRFMTRECPEAFMLFGIIGVFFIMANSREKGTKMLNLSILSFIIMKVLGACM